MELDQCAEVREVNVGQANEYLKHGWVLIAVYGIAFEALRTDSTVEHPTFLRRRLHYVMGRPQGVDPFKATARGLSAGPDQPNE